MGVKITNIINPHQHNTFHQLSRLHHPQLIPQQQHHLAPFHSPYLTSAWSLIHATTTGQARQAHLMSYTHTNVEVVVIEYVMAVVVDEGVLLH